ncbi:MAG: hypothetical protein IJH34_06815 [Romboutsia sp.]|nr:hypothetical protein [Romboutsia sp.]
MSKSIFNISKLGKKLSNLVLLSVGSLLFTISIVVIGVSNNEFDKHSNEQVKFAMDSVSITTNSWLEGLAITFKSLGDDKLFVQGVKDLSSTDTIIRGSIKNKNVSESISYVQSKLDALYSHGSGAILSAYIGTPNNQFQQAPFEELDSSFNCIKRDWYKDAVKSDEYKISKPYTDYSLQVPCVTISYPIKENNKVIGVIGIDIPLSSVCEKIKSYNIGNEGFVSLLIEENGKYKSMYNSQESLENLTYGKYLVSELKNKESEYQVEGFSELASDIKTKSELLKEDDTLKLATLKINNKKYKVALVKDEVLDIYQLVGLSTKEMNAPLSRLARDLVIMSIVFGCMNVIGVASSLNKSADYINNISSVVNRLKNKELNTKIEGKGLNSKDEIGNLSNDVNTMIDSLTDMIKDISNASSSLNSSSQELSVLASTAVGSADDISTSMQSITNASTEQTTHSQLCTSLSSELSNKLDNAASSSQEMKSLAEEVITTNKKGLDAVTKLQSSTLDTNPATSTIETTILNLDHKTETINSIVETISNISEQTNLLALNASIEAARAGDAGRGFSVVADEVKKLAEQSHVAANKIKYIIEDVKLDVHEAVLNAKDVKEIVSIQNNSVSDVNNSFDEISSSIEKISLVIAEVSQLILDVNLDKDNIVKALEHMMALNEETSASCEEVYSTTESQIETFKKLSDASTTLYELSAKLNTLTNQFEL